MQTSPSRIHVVVSLAVAWLGGCDPGARPAPTGSAASAAAPSAVPAAQAVTRGAITIDDAHDVMKGGTTAYSIPPSTELVVDGSGHVFASVDAAGLGQPNAVHVVHGAAAYYRATFAGKWPIRLNAVSLDAVKGGVFTGFEPGEPYIVAVGAEATGPDGAMKFAPAWTAKVTVTSP